MNTQGFPIDGIQLDQANPEFYNAVELVAHTRQLIFVTGKAGTGKTTFLKHIRHMTDKNCVILAPTGVAAINAGGMTIHSFFKLPLKPLLPDDPNLSTDRNAKGKNLFKTLKYNKEKLEVIRNMELLIIDEVSMVRCDILDIIDKILRVYRNRPDQAFGGVQVVLIGDNFQLPPVLTQAEKEIIRSVYESEFFFSAAVIRENTPVYIELKKIYRQKDQRFIDMLNRIRLGQTLEQDIRSLNARVDTELETQLDDRITLSTHRAEAARINQARLVELKGKMSTYVATIKGEFPEKSMPTEERLELKVGAQVMFIRNDSGISRRYFNGKIGRVIALKKNVLSVIVDKDTEIEVERNTWENIKYTYNKETGRVEEEVLGTFIQFPLKLAWAITVHKSQGLTFEKIIADLGNAFAPGQVYVALSRCTSINGLRLKAAIGYRQIKVNPDVLEFAKRETPETLISNHLKSGRADALYRQSRQEFIRGDMASAIESFRSAMELRDDSATEAFRRFVSVYGNRYHQFQSHLHKIATAMNIQRKEMEKLDSQLNKLENVLRRKKQEYSKIGRANKQLVQQVESLEKIRQDLEARLSSAKESLAKNQG